MTSNISSSEKNSSQAIEMAAYTALEENLNYVKGLMNLDSLGYEPSYYFIELLENFLDEIRLNLDSIRNRKNGEKIVESYFSILFEKIDLIQEHFKNKAWPIEISFNKIAEYKNINPGPVYEEKRVEFLRQQHATAQILKAEVIKIKHDHYFTNNLNGDDDLSELTLAERLIVIRCLQNDELFIWETQVYSQKNIIQLLSTLLQKDPATIKSAYQKADRYIKKAPSDLEKQERDAIIKSLRKIEKSLVGFPNVYIEHFILIRIKQLELAN